MANGLENGLENGKNDEIQVVISQVINSFTATSNKYFALMLNFRIVHCTTHLNDASDA